jgi:hypothetical protein
MEHVTCQSELLHVVDTTRAAGCLTRLLDRWQQESYQNPDDRNHDQQFNQSETTLIGGSKPGSHQNLQYKKEADNTENRKSQFRRLTMPIELDFF